MTLNSIDKKLAAGSLHVTSNTTGYVIIESTSCVFSVRENKNLHHLYIWSLSYIYRVIPDPILQILYITFHLN